MSFFIHLSTLDFSDVAVVLKLHPVCFVQFGSDEEVQIDDLIIFSHQRGGQTQFTVSLDDRQHAAEHLGCQTERKNKSSKQRQEKHI